MPQNKVVIVGGAGFIGSHLVNLLSSLGKQNILVLGRRPSAIAPLPLQVKYEAVGENLGGALSGTLNDGDDLIDLSHVPSKAGLNNILEVTADNLPRLCEILQLATERKLRKIILVSSGGTVYGEPNYLPIDEQHETNPISPYGVVKLLSEKIGMMYHHSHELPITIVRPGNPYGPAQTGENGQGFIGIAIREILKGQKVTVFGNRGTVRDYLHVSDLAKGIVAALDYGVSGQIYNIGSGEGHDNIEILEILGQIAKRSGFSIEIKYSEPRKPDVSVNILNSSRLESDSGWTPLVNLENGIETTWQWALSEESSFLSQSRDNS